MKQLEKVDCRYGAPMGRRQNLTGFDHKARCFRVLLSEGYDDGGAYWGSPMKPPFSLWCAKNDAGLLMFVWADNRKEAKSMFETNAKKINQTIKWVN